MVPFDNNLSHYCNEKKIRFTRYADDITVSGDLDSDAMIEFVNTELKNFDLSLNESKIKVMGRNVRQIVTGLVVNDKIQVPKIYRNNIKQVIFFIKKLGLDAHLKNTQNKRSNYLRHLLGKINFVLQINPNDVRMKEYKNFVYTLFT